MKRKVEMTLTPESSSIAAIGYDSKECRLFVRFKAESLYCYAEVGITTFNNFLGAPSKGTFLANAIKPFFPRVVSLKAGHAVLKGVELVYSGGGPKPQSKKSQALLPGVADQRWAW